MSKSVREVFREKSVFEKFDIILGDGVITPALSTVCSKEELVKMLNMALQHVYDLQYELGEGQTGYEELMKSFNEERKDHAVFKRATGIILVGFGVIKIWVNMKNRVNNFIRTVRNGK